MFGHLKQYLCRENTTSVVSVQQDKTYLSYVKNFENSFSAQTQIKDVELRTHIFPLAEKMASWVESIPASEFHHHSQPFGLLVHSFECALYADRICDSVVLSQLDCSLDEKDRDESAVRILAVALALLHDIGKVVYDIEVFDQDGNKWRPWACPLTVFSEGKTIDIHWRKNRIHKRHELFSLFLCTSLLSDQFLMFLSDKGLFDMFTLILNGEDRSSSVANIVIKADRMSVRENFESVQEQNDPNEKKTENQHLEINNRPEYGLELIDKRKDSKKASKEEETSHVSSLWDEALQKINLLIAQMKDGTGMYLVGPVTSRQDGSLVTSSAALDRIAEIHALTPKPLLVAVIAASGSYPRLVLQEDELILVEEGV